VHDTDKTQKWDAHLSLRERTGFLQVNGSKFLDGEGQPLTLTGVNLGGVLLMENSITGFAGVESTMRRGVLNALGRDRYDRFFSRLIHAMFSAADAKFLRSVGFNCVRIPLNYRHLESDDEPYVLLPDAFDHIDRIVNICRGNGLYSIIDLHALPGAQNQHWHSDNPTHVAQLWEQSQFQERSIWLWAQIADHFKSSSAVAGYNLINEPADPTRQRVGALYKRMVAAIRERDPDHVLFLDGNTYATEFDVFDGSFSNTVYTVHDYVEAGFKPAGVYPGHFDGDLVDKMSIERNFLKRTDYPRQTGTPIFVGEFGPVRTGQADVDAGRAHLLRDQLEIYREHDASWAFWTYKAVRGQGLVGPHDQSAYASRFGDFMEKKDRLGVDAWASRGTGCAGIQRAVKDLLRQEFPDYSPYPRGQDDWVDTLLLHILVADPLSVEYAGLFVGASDAEVDALADSFRMEQCVKRPDFIQTFAEALAAG